MAARITWTLFAQLELCLQFTMPQFRLRTLLALVGLTALSLAIWRYINQPPTIRLGMSRKGFVALLENYEPIVDLPPPQFKPYVLDATSVLYWKDISEEWILEDFSVTILAAFENGNLVHLMAWDWDDYRSSLSGRSYLRVRAIALDVENSTVLLHERHD